jgi:two-component system NtrC family sensor kinase
LNLVLETIGEIACRLCAAYDVSILMRYGDKLRVTYLSGPIGGYPVKYDFALTRGYVMGRCVIDAKPVHVADLRAEAAEFPEGAANAAELGHRTILAVPLLQGDRAVGTIVLRRLEVQPFAVSQVALLKTFADQAVIAIENTRLFEAEQASKRELQESLEYQTATSDVLGVISRSPSQLQPVLDTIVTTATKLCEGFDATILLRDGNHLRVGAHHGGIALDFEHMNVGRGWITGRAVLDCQPVHVHDLAVAKNEFPEGYDLSLRHGHRTGLAVPLLRDDQAIGAFMIRRVEVRPFSEKQISLLQTFADQAVIAIENTRLFEEVQARTKELTESLEYQTATSEVLSVISKSPNNLQPVLDAIVVTAQRLCQAEYTLFSKREDDGCYHIKAGVSADPQFVDWVRAHPIVTGDGSMVGIVAAERQTMHFPDCLVEPRFTDLARQRQSRARTMLGVPLLRGGDAIGVIFLARTVVRPFTDRQIALVTTFANQAVIAIENARLFEVEQASASCKNPWSSRRRPPRS